MSIRVMADVWDNGPEDAVLTAVLVVLANSADDSGGNCFPGNALIAQRTRYCERTVMRALAELERQGWIVILERGGGRPRRGARKQDLAEYHTQYRINVAKLKGRQSVMVSGEKGCQSVMVSEAEKGDTEAEKGDSDGGERVTLTTEKGDFRSNPPHPLIGRSVKDPSEGSVSKNKSPLPPPGKREGEKTKPELSAAARRAAEQVCAACGVTDRRWARAIGVALAAHAARERMAEDAVALGMIAAWREHMNAVPWLYVVSRPDKFFTQGLWLDEGRWLWDRAKLAEQKRRSAASVGVWSPA